LTAAHTRADPFAAAPSPAAAAGYDAVDHSIEKRQMEVEIWSDIACPWCYIGKRRFERALERFEHAEQVSVRWRSFELDPEAPPEQAGSRTERLAAKYGISAEQARKIERQIAQAAAGEGLRFRLEAVRGGPTRDAHRLIQLAHDHRLGDAMKERLLCAYFEEGELICDPATLTRLALEVGLPQALVVELLAGERYLDRVRADERAAAALGISAVPTFVIDRAIGVSGAQEPAVLLELLRRGWERREPLAVALEGQSCSLDGC
jgi:predicted DsbA family dithiol-disulfide isomerase